jgi:hypothetical protein
MNFLINHWRNDESLLSLNISQTMKDFPLKSYGNLN